MKSSGLAANVKVVDGAVVDHNSVVSMNQETKFKDIYEELMTLLQWNG